MKNIFLLIILFLFSHKFLSQETVFPPEAFSDGTQEGLLDITKEPFNADSSGQKDCTDAFIKAYDFVMKRVLEHRQIDYRRWVNIIYIPNGVYRVNRPIVYTGDPVRNSDGHERISGIRFLGQNYKKTVIYLAENSPAFNDPENPLPLISYGKRSINNAVSSNFFENITIKIGKGNPGAIGLRFHGANNQAMRDVSIISEDGMGVVGLDLGINVCQGYYKNIYVEGFDYGVRVIGSHATCPVFEYLYISNQNIAGVLPGPGGTCIRKLYSVNKVPAIYFTKKHGHCVVIDSELKGGSKENSAIDYIVGHLFLRNIQTEGYKFSLKKKDSVIVKGKYIDEYVSDEVLSLYPVSEKKSLNLPIEDPPEIPWESDFSQWACVNDYGADPYNREDDSREIQKAMNSGKSVIYFKPGKYVISETIIIPPTVKRVNFMFSMLIPTYPLDSENLPAFKVKGDTTEPVIIENLVTFFEAIGKQYWFEQASTRTVILSDMHSQRTPMYRNSAKGSKLFLENVSACRGNNNDENDIPFIFSKEQEVWARWINPEKSLYGHIVNDNASLWLFGFKTEHVGVEPLFQLINGSITEILGGLFNTYGHHSGIDVPGILIQGSYASIILHTTGPTRDSESHLYTLIKDQKLGKTKYLIRDDVPKRENSKKSLIPLYISR